MPRKLDDILSQASNPDTVSDTELDDLKQEIVRDVTATLMFGELPTPRRSDPARLEQAANTLQALCRTMLRDDEASEHLARIADSPTDAEGALRFGCLLDLAKKPDGALWWWQFAAGAGNAAAAYCLYLFHTRRGDLRDAAHWWYQHRALGPDSLDLRHSQVLSSRGASSGALREAVERLKVAEAAGEFHHPDHRLADQIEELVNRF
ncbi:hypothetical protein [Streptomyces caniscabiei]|uniref:hypothetical protein n=1 Tax=Streptomyces caniscabiei TaxID=2746961 RepID=UPI0007659B41|nr:hypothetical protein [Streptomyces caniscabiei]